jgi:hypothetical protein
LGKTADTYAKIEHETSITVWGAAEEVVMTGTFE